MSYNAKNYTEQGGRKTVIGGELVVTGKLTLANGAEISGLPNVELPVITVADHQEDSTATTVAALKDDLNALLAKLQVAGLMEDAEP